MTMFDNFSPSYLEELNLNKDSLIEQEDYFKDGLTRAMHLERFLTQSQESSFPLGDQYEGNWVNDSICIK